MKYLFIVTLLVNFYTSLLSQPLPEDFRMDLLQQKTVTSVYNKMEFLDSRYDTTDMGFVLTGATNRKSSVITTTPLCKQFLNIFNVMRDPDSGNGELLLQLRRLQFYQMLGTGTEKGYCSIRVSLYKKKNDGYLPVAFADTLLAVKAADARKPLFEKAGEFFVFFLLSHLSDKGVDRHIYSFTDVTVIDSLEKINIPLYEASTFTDGYYKSFSSFSNMKPDGAVAVEMRDDKIDVVKTTGSKAKLTKILYGQDVYAIVFKGQPYISTNYGYYPLTKLNGDFLFTGRASTYQSSSGPEAMNRFAFGIIGALLEPKQTALYRIKIDHITGHFVILEEIKR